MMCLLPILGVLAQENTEYRTIDTTLVFSESDFEIYTHPRTGFVKIDPTNNGSGMWDCPSDVEKAIVPWRVLNIYVARDESFHDVSYETFEETLFAENLKIMKWHSPKDYLNEDFPEKRIYNSTFKWEINPEHTGLQYFYQFQVSPFRYESQKGLLYFYKKIRIKVRIKKNPPTIITVRGTVKDQDGNRIPNATLTFANKEYDIDESGQFAMTFSLTTYTNGFPYDNISGNLEVKAEGYTPFELPTSFDNDWANNETPIEVKLYNRLDYKAGKRYTIVLPEEPEASHGRYFRLDRVGENSIIFERDFSPKANVPYVFFPEKDVSINLEGMDFTREPEQIIINDIPAESQTSVDPRLFMIGSYVTGGSRVLISSYVKTRLEEDEYYQDVNSHYNSDAMHARMYSHVFLFSDTPALIFNDPSNLTAIPSLPSEIVNSKSVNNNWYDLSGRRLNTSHPTYRGVYIIGGKKVVVK